MTDDEIEALKASAFAVGKPVRIGPDAWLVRVPEGIGAGDLIVITMPSCCGDG